MEVDVLLFGPAASAAGAPRVTVRLGGDHTVDGLRAALGDQHASVRPFLGAARLAVNHAYAALDAEVRTGDEVALIALVSGG